MTKPTMRERVHPELEPFIDPALAAFGEIMVFGGDKPLAQIRAEFKLAGNARLQDLPPLQGAVLTVDKFPSYDGTEIELRVATPEGADKDLPLLFWIHGGGMVVGDAASDDYMIQHWACLLGARVTSVEYRLAPEHPHPTPIEDCYAALQYIVAKTTPARICIGGVSAGGGLAAGLALLARDRGAPQIGGQVLVYPMLDDRNIQPADERYEDTLLWTRAANHYGWTSYLGGKAADIYAAPARADDLSGLPPCYLPTGELDLFLEENMAYAQKLIAAGVGCELHVFPGAPHAFNALAPEASITQTLNKEMVEFFSYILTT